MRKKILPIIITLLALCSTKAFATNYDLWVAGVRVTSSNASHITGSGISGSVSYSYSTNTLTLNGVDITVSVIDKFGIKSNIPGLKIQLEGINTISTYNDGIWSQADLTIQGSGTLIVTSTNEFTIEAEGNLTFSSCTVEVISFTSRSIVGTSGKTLTVNGGSLTIYGDDIYTIPIYGFGHLSMAEGTSITYPANVHYDEASMRLKDADGNTVHGDAAIESVNHSLWVAGHRLGGGNSGTGTYTFTGTGITGTVTYDFSTNTLTLNNTNITASSLDDGIESNISGLKIQLEGTNIITTDTYGIHSYADLTIQGTGTLFVTSTDNITILAKGNLTFSSCTVEARNNSHTVIAGTLGKTLTVNGGSLSAQCNSGAYPIEGFGHLSMAEGTSITYPANAHYDEYYRLLEYANGNSVCGGAAIESVNRSLWVAGHKLGGSNSSMGTYTFTGTGITGTVTYDFGTNTLFLIGASITTSNDGSSRGIESNIPGLIIQLVGSNTINTYDYGICYYADMTIQGSGTLNVTADQGNAIYAEGNLTFSSCTVNVTADQGNAIYAEGNLTFSSCTVEARSNRDFGILGTSGKTLTVNGGSLTAEGGGTYGNPIYGFGHLSMAERTNITYPVNASYNQYDRCLRDANGNYVTGEAVIESVNHSLLVARHRLGGGSSGTGTYTFSGTGITGTVTYDFGTNTLSLSNASITASGEHNYGIESNIPGLKIQLEGSNNISTYDDGVRSYADLTIQGTGTLNVTADAGNAIDTEGNLTFSSCTVEARSNDDRGIHGTWEKILTVNGGSLAAQGSGTYGYPISGFGHLSMAEGTSITYPANVHYDEASNRLEYADGSAVTGKAAIESVNHSLWVAGHRLGGGNSGTGTYTFTGDGITGTVTYSFGANTLALSNASIIASGSGNYGIESNIPGLKIQLVGNSTNTINTTDYGIYAQADMTIQGTGTLNVTSTGSTAIYAQADMTIQGTGTLNVTADQNAINAEGNLTFSSCTVEARVTRDNRDGIVGTSGKTLTVNGGSLTAQGRGTYGYPISGFGHLSMAEGTSITYPANVHYDEAYKTLRYADGRYVHGEAVIELAKYDIWVKGTRVTGANASDVLDDGGTVIYDAEENTLTLNGATITSTSDNAIKNQMSGLKIVLVGNNTVNSTIASGIFSNQDFFIEGNGSLYVTGKDGIYAVGCNLTISGGCAVAATGNGGDNYGGVYGSQTKTLTISESTVMAQTSSTNRSGITGFGDLTLNHIGITTPSGGTYHDGNVYDGNTVYYGKYNNQIRPVVISPIYNLYVKGIQVTSANATDILGDGKVSYDAAANTLTLNGAYIYTSEHEGIRNGIDGLKINLEGNSQITSTVAEGILSEVDAALTIQGSGNLVVKGTTGIGVNKSLTITGGCRVDAESSGRFANSAIEGYMSNSTFTVNASTVIARSDRTIQGTIYGFGTFSCTGNAGITYPTGAHWCSTHHRIEDSDDVMLTGAVTISSATYNLYVKDIQVTNGNMDDVLGDGGSVSYNPSSCTLTLNNANITNTGTGNDGIRNSINGLKINLVGSSTITAGRYGVQMGAANTTFTGNGSLSINARYGLYSSSSSGHTLTLSVGCHLNIVASAYGIGYGYGTLSIDRAELRVKGGSNYATITCNALNLTEVSIMSPEGATFSNGYVRDANNNIIAGDYVVIGAQPYDLYVKGVQVSPVNRDDILGDGHASYDPGNNTLTLNNLTVSTISNFGMRNLIAGLTIKLIGTNSINASNYGIYSDKDFTIEGSYTDVLNVSGCDGIYADWCNLTIRGGCNVTATGKTNNTSCSGIYGSSSKTFRIINSSVTAQKQAPSSGSIVGYPISGFQPQITGCTISPTGMSWSNGHYVDGNGTAVTDPIVIAPIDYNIVVAGIRVTSANCNDVFADSTRFHPATVSYDPTSNILTLNDARISTSAYGIRNEKAGLKINVVGYSTIASSGSSGIYTTKSLVIQGNGELRVEGKTGITASYCNLTIKDVPKMWVYGTGGSGYGCIYGYSGHSLTINRSHLIARSGNNLSYSAIYGFSNLNFTDNKVQFIQPSDGTYTSRSVYSGGSVYKGEVEIDGLPYGFKIDGMEVTTANCENFTYGVESGTISYDNTNHTLTLDNAVFGPTTLGDDAIENYDLEIFRIQLIGDNLITHCGEGKAINTFALEQGDGTFFTIMGPGTLVCEGEMEVRGEGEGHDQGQCVFSIVDDADVCMANNATIYSYANSSLIDLEVANSTLRAYQITGLKGFNDLPSSNAYVDAPDGADFSYSVGNGSIALNGAVAEDVVIITDYQLCVAGVWVTSLNAHDIRSEHLTSGTASYDVASHTLTLNNVNIVVEDDDNELGNGICSKRDFNIELIGENSIASVNNDGIYCWDGLHILGSGSLSVQGINGIRQHTFASHDFELSGACSVNVVSTGSGDCAALKGNNRALLISSGCHLFAQNSSLSNYSPIYGFNDLQLVGVEILQPLGAVYSTSHERIEDEQGNQLNAPVEIGNAEYDLWICGEQVTSANVNSLSNLAGVSGNVSFNHSTNTLTLDNATLNSDDFPIVSQIDGLTIYLSGSNRIEAETGSGLSITNANTTITGGGSMNFAVGQYSIVATDMGGKLLTIEDECEVNNMFQTSVGGISTDGMLRINNAYVYMDGDYPIIANDLMLDYVEITCPAGGWFDATSHQIKDAQGNVATGQVSIEAIGYDLYVADIPVMASNADDILGDGTVSYDAASNTLTLNGATITNTGGSGIDNNIDNLNIFLVGDNTINCEEGIILYADATISGTGNLTINAEYGVHGYEDWQNILPSLILTGGCQVNVNANEEGISLCRYDSDNWEGGVLMVDRSTLALTMDENYYSTTIQCRDLVLNGAEVTVPTGYYFNSYHHLMDSDGSVPLHVVIEPIKYDLWVAGIQVSPANAAHITGEGISGTVSYDAATNTLTLNGATVYDAEYGSGIIDYIDGLNIVLEGGNSIETLGGDGISLYANATISGTGRLDVNARYGIYGYDNYLNDLPSLTLEGGCQVSVAATEDGVNIGEGLMNVGGVLTVDNSTLEVTKENSLHTSIKCRDLVLVGTEVVTPEGYHFNEYNSLVGPTGVVPMYVLIGPIRYDLWVAGIQVSPANAAHITGEGISGTVSYDAATNTLTLDNAFIENSPDGGDGYGIVSEIDGLTISLRGENGISSNEDGISLINVNTSITGGGMLNIYSPYGIYGYSGTNNVTLTISNESTVSLDCSSQGIYLNSMALCIDRSTVEVIGDAYYGVYASNGWQLIDVEITSPYEAYWNGHYVLDAEGQVVGGGIVIEPIRYELFLADTQVTALNAADVLGEGISGTVSYDATTNTLTLNEATITNEGGWGIETNIDNLNIVLVGTNTIQTIDGEGIRLFADATISGTGSLAIEARDGIYGYITDDNVFPSLTLEGGCQVNVDAIEVGIHIFWNLESTGGVLTVDNSTLEVTNDKNSYFATTVQCRDLVLNGVEVTDPEAYYFNDYYELVGSDDQEPNRVLIEPCNVFTGTVSVDWNNPSNWSKGELPLATSKVHVAAQCVMDEDAEVKRIVIEEMGSMNLINGAVLTVETITNSDASRFVITNGQLYCDNEVSGTFHKTVTIADADENGWNAIAVPMNSPSIANLTANTYDIYTYDEDADQNEWQNYKDSPFSFVPGQGYLYANSDFTDLVMTGTFKPSSQTVTIPLSYGAQHEGIRGFNLVGNPYPRKLSMSEIKIDGEPITIYYRLVEGTNGSEFVPCTSGDILPGEGFFIKATAPGQTLTMEGE